jgi:hypothetical protein
MGDVTNLKRFRKQKARAEKRRTADAKAARHGRTDSERAAGKARVEKAARDLDGHRRE